MSKISDAWHTLVREAKDMVNDIVSAFLDASAATLRKAGPVLLQAATDAVLTAQTAPGDGAAKRQAAFNIVLADLKAKGLPIVESEVNLALEAAVQNMKASAPVAAQ